MPQSQPSINGVAGSDANLPLNTLVQLNNVGSGGETSYLWSIVSQPSGTAVALSNASIVNPTFTPTKEGSYLISLTVNGTLLTKVIAGVRELKSGLRIPATGETTEVSATAGWSGDVDALLLSLLNSQADPGVLVGVAMDTSCITDTVLYAAGASVIKTGLPGEETLPGFAAALESDPDGLIAWTGGPLYLALGGVDGSATPGAGDLIRVRAFGRAAISVGAVGDPIFANRSAELTAPTPDRVARQVGTQLSASQIYFDGRYASNAVLDLYESIISDIPVGPATASRIIHRDGVLQLSEEGGAFTPLTVTDAAFLVSGASANPSAINIRTLTAALEFICTGAGGKISLQRASAGDTGIKFELLNELGVVVATLSGDGGVSFTTGAFDSIELDGGELQMNGGNIDSCSDAVIAHAGIEKLSLDQGATLIPSGSDEISLTSNFHGVDGTSTSLYRIDTTGLAQGYQVTIFAETASLSVKDSQLASGAFLPLFLQGSTSFTLALGGRITLVYATVNGVDGWYELSRVEP